MPSLKEVKTRINSVRTTRKITQARQMVSSAQLHRAQSALGKARACLETLQEVLAGVGPQLPADSPWFGARQGHGGRVGVVAVASDGGMCGSFNARMAREAVHVAQTERPMMFPVGRKMREALRAAGVDAQPDLDALDGRTSTDDVAALADSLARRFLSGELARLDVIYSDFRSVGSHRIVRTTLLPVSAPTGDDRNYIVEPSPGGLAEVLLPMLFAAQFNAAVASGRASEHAARMLAMQLATENADDLLDDLQLSYNKLRQQNITSELLDIIGSSFA